MSGASTKEAGNKAAPSRVSDPAPAGGIVVVALQALALCPYAEINRSAAPGKGSGQPAKPVVSVGAAGIVTLVPDSADTGLKVGDEIWTRVPVGDPATIEHVTVPARHAFALPVGISLAQAATLGDSGLMALAALREGNIGRRSRVLIHGVANPFGSAATALAVYLGAEVIATVDSNAELQIAAAAGATRVAPPKPRDAALMLKSWAGERGFDVILDAALTEHMPLNAELLAQNGLILTCPLQGRLGDLRGVDTLTAKNGQVRFLSSSVLEQHDLAEMAQLINESICRGRHRPLVGQIVAPTELDAALTQLARGRLVGNLVLQPGSGD